LLWTCWVYKAINDIDILNSDGTIGKASNKIEKETIEEE
jgi:hypothetical protein